MSGFSWDTYIDGLLTSGKIADAAILGRKGGAWAISKGFELSPDEQRDVISFFKPEDTARPAAAVAKKAGAKETTKTPEVVIKAGEKAGEGAVGKAGEGAVGKAGEKAVGKAGGKDTDKAGGKDTDKTGGKETTETPEVVIKTGVHLAKQKYFTLTTSDDTILLRKGADGALFVTTKQAILVAIYKQPTQAQEALAVVDHYATYLKNSGY